MVAVPRLVDSGDGDGALQLLSDVIELGLILSDDGSATLLTAAIMLHSSKTPPQDHVFLDRLIDHLIAHGSIRTLASGTSYLIGAGRYGEALTVMGRAYAMIFPGHTAFVSISMAYANLAAIFEKHVIVLSVYNSLPDEERAELRTKYIEALLAVGQFRYARTLCDDLLADDAFRAPGDAPTKERHIELLLSLSSVAYAMGDYDTYWSTLGRVLGYRGAADLTSAVRTDLDAIYAVTHPTDCAEAITALADARDAAVGPLERFLTAFAYVRVLAPVIEMLDQDRPETAAYVQDMTVVARDLYSADDLGMLGVAIAWPTIAYLRFMADDRFAAGALVSALAAQSTESGESWRGDVILALASLRSGDAAGALAYSRKALALRPWDLDTRCIAAQAALQSGDHRLAIDTAEGVLRVAPGHLQARLLLAEALTVDSVANDAAGDDVEQLIQIAREFSVVVADSSRLTEYLTHGSPVSGLCSNEVPSSLKTYAARRGLQACIRAGRALGNANLPADDELRVNGEAMLSYLRSMEDTNVPRLEVLLRAVQRQRLHVVATRRVIPLVGGGLLVVAAAMSFGHGRVLQLAGILAVIAFAGIFWPRVRKITLAGVEVEIPEFGADAQRSAEFVDRLLRSPRTTMPAVQSMSGFASALLRTEETGGARRIGPHVGSDNPASRGVTVAASETDAVENAREGSANAAAVDPPPTPVPDPHNRLGSD